MGCERCGNQDVEKWNISPVDLKPGRNRGYYRFFKFFYSEPKIIRRHRKTSKKIRRMKLILYLMQYSWLQHKNVTTTFIKKTFFNKYRLTIENIVRKKGG